MPRHIACLTFDFDALSIWIARGMTSPGALSRGEFGVIGAKRLLALLKTYNITSTWFIPGHTIETYPDACREVADAGHEIAHHGWTHMSPLTMTKEAEETELIRGIEAIRHLVGKKPRGYRSPSWDLSENTVELLLKHDFYYGSQLMGHDSIPTRTRIGDIVELQRPAVFGRPTRLIDMPVSWSLDDAPHFELVRTANWVQQGLMSAPNVLSNWIGDFEYLVRSSDWGVLTYTCHPYCIGRGHRILMLEKLIQRLLELGAVFLQMQTAAVEFDRREPFQN
jgi:peptidoglycan-N-acetylglucosamine deacetylase